MPEGDTVWLAAQRMQTALAGATLRRGEFRLPQLAAVDLTGVTVREVVPRGKHLLIRLADERTLRTHFRMDGSWHIYRPGTKWRGGPAYDVRVVLATDDWECVGYRLHDVEIVPTAEEAPARRPPRSRRPRPGLGPRRGAAPAARARPTSRSASRSSTSATSPGSATSTRSRRCSSAACTRGRGWPTSTTSQAVVNRARTLMLANRTTRSRPRPAISRRGRGPLGRRPQAGSRADAVRHPDPAGRAGAAPRRSG